MSYIIINYPKFKAFTSAGAPASGYKVYSYAPGTTTAQATYSERTLTSANTNPIILDSVGECVIYTGRAVKLVLKTSADVTVWTFDYLAEQQDTFVIASTVTSSHNQYTVTSSPAVGALSANLTLMMTPDATNATTLTLNTFNGTGVDDCTEGGAYTGTTTGSSYYITIDGAYQAPPVAPTAAENVAAGLVTVGNHYVKLTAVTAIGETIPGAASGVVAAAGSKKIDVTGIPAIASQVTGYNVYMTEAGGTDYYLVNLTPITATTYTISIADATLATQAAAPTTDTTGIADTFSWRKDTGAETPGVAITADGTTQAIAEGLTVQFAVKANHTLGDYWKIDVETPARVNLDGLGSLIVYKNKGGSIVALDGSDMYAGYPAQLVLNAALNAWLLINPATPTFSTTEVSAVRYRKNLATNYTLLLADQGFELNFTSAATLTLLAASTFGNRFFYAKNSSTGLLTIDATADYLIYGNDLTGTRYLYLGPGETYQLQTNGIDWHVLTTTGYPVLLSDVELSADASYTFSNLFPGFNYKIDYELTTGGNGYILIRFNADTGANYAGRISWIDAVPAIGVDGAGGGLTSIMVTCAYTQLTYGEINFNTAFGDDTNVIVLGSAYGSVLGGIANFTFGGFYNGAADLTSVTILADGTASTLTGRVRLYRVG